MAWFRRGQKQQVVVYGMGHDGSAPVIAALKRCRDVMLHHVYTLDRAKVAALMMRDDADIPDHIHTSDMLLRDGLAGNKPYLFVTLYRDPFCRHARQAFALLQQQMNPDAAVSHAHACIRSFESLPAVQTTDWFETEYQPATGIDVYAQPFDALHGYQTYTLGAHRFLLLSSHLDGATQASILSTALGSDVPAIEAHGSQDGLQSLFKAHVLSADHARVASQFWGTRFSRHFFTVDQIDSFHEQLQGLMDDIARDPRLVRALATHWQRDGAIIRPLGMLKSTVQTEQVERHSGMLQVQADLLTKPFAFSAPAQRAYEPAAKTVLYNVHQSLPFHTSGYATRTQGLIKGLQDKGWHLQVVGRAGYPLDTGIPADDAHRVVDGIAYTHDQRSGVGKRDLALDAYIDQAADYLVQKAMVIRPAVLHTASNYICGMAGIEAARRLGIPSIYEMRGLWHVTRWSKEPDYASSDQFALAQKLELECAASADHILAITGALKEWLVEHGIVADKISLAPNAVDLTQFYKRDRDDDFARGVGCDGKIVIGYIGSFVQYEGLDLLIEAVAMLSPSLRQKIRLLWMGDGPVLDILLTQARDAGIGDCIVSLGRRPFEDVPRAYSIVDITAFPRKGQPICEIVSPLKPFEAMAMHKAVIASDVRPLKEIVRHEVTGLLHEKDNAVSLSAQLVRFIEDEPLRIACGDRAQQWVKDTRNWGMIAADVGEVYKKWA